MNRLMELYGQGYQPSDGEVVDTRTVMNNLMRNQAYEQSGFGKVNALLQAQTDKLEGSSGFNPVNMLLEGAKTANRWLGATQYPEQVQYQDMLAPLGVAAMTAPFMPRNALGSAGGKLLASASNDLPMDEASRMARAREMGFDTDRVYYRGTNTHETDARPNTWVAEDPSYANSFASGDGGNVMPILVRGDYAPAGWALSPEEAKRAGFGGRDFGDRTKQIFDPKNIRSVNAAFDPAKSDSANLLAADQARSSVPGTVVNAAASEPQGIRAYHGSPHDFDKFSMEHIGKGEGAQSYGHGLYFAEAEDVAKSYRDMFRTGPGVGKQPFSAGNPEHIASFELKNTGGDIAGAIARIEAFAARSNLTPAEKNSARQAIEVLQRGDVQPWKEQLGSGRMYEVNIKANPEDFLDWDKPLSQQSETIQKFYNDRTAPKLRTRDIGENPNIGKLTDVALSEGGSLGVFTPEKLADVLANPAKYAPTTGADLARGNEAALREAGIPGIRYLDQGSRGKGEGTSNYVVFDDKLIDILRKYGIMGAIGGGAMMGGQDADAAE